MFRVPRPFAYYDPVCGNFVSSTHSMPPRPGPSAGRRPSRPIVNHLDFKLIGLDGAAYAMDCVTPLPLSVSRVIRELFYPPLQASASDPSLCRLYFGKIIEDAGFEGRPKKFFNSSNFPLDRARYKLLKDKAADFDLVSMEDIAVGMGEMLGRVDFLAGFDGRDVEFVLGGETFSGVSLYVIDFNQLKFHSFFSTCTLLNRTCRCNLHEDAPLESRKGGY